MSSSYHKTLSLCSQLLATFKPELLGVEDHLDNFLKSDSCIVRFSKIKFEKFNGKFHETTKVIIRYHNNYASDSTI